MFEKIVAKTLKVPALAGTKGDGSVVARQLDVALISVGFKLSGELLDHLSEIHPTVVKDAASRVLAAVRQLVGDHVEHNSYFRDFPANVPDTVEFWTECIIDALFDPDSASKVALQLSVGMVNLLDLPKYGRYQHSYEEMLAAHEQFIPSVKDRVTVLHLGKSLAEEALELYHSLAGSSIPLNESDRELLVELAEVCLGDQQPVVIPVRENRAVINQVRLVNGQPILVDTVTDILRLACALSGGDETLEVPTRFKSFKRRERQVLMTSLEAVVSKSPAQLADVGQYREPWKRLGERLHPHEYRDKYQQAKEVFAVARGDRRVRPLAAKVELAFADGNIGEAIRLLAVAPGMLCRNLDRVLRAADSSEIETLVEAVQTVVGKVSGRVILSLVEHLGNRMRQGQSRVFVNSKGKAWVAEDARKPLDEEAVAKIAAVLDLAIEQRLPAVERLVVDPAVLKIALPMSEKTKARGFGILPRGTVSPVTGDILRFFIYWKQHNQRTDYDLSALMLDENFQYKSHLSWTRLRDGESDGGWISVHSGDLTEAVSGASEFIDVNLTKIDCQYIDCQYVVPQVNIYAGEGFNEVEECFFGFMERSLEQAGKPFEARTVRMKSDLRGAGRVALPLVFIRNDDGSWSAKWLQLYLSGSANFNRVEANRVSTALLGRSIVDRQYLCLEYLVELWRRKATSFTWYVEGERYDAPVTFIGLEAPEGLPEGSQVFTPANWHELIPA